MLQGATGRDGNYFLLSRLDASSVSSRRSPRLHIQMRSTTLRVGAGVGNQMLCLRTEEERGRRRILTGVPGGGIEPPTRGFSVPCSTD